MVIKLTVQTDIASRLDRYLRRFYPALTQGQIEQALRKNKIKLNEQKIAASHKVAFGDVITIAESLQFTGAARLNPVTESSPAAVALAKKVMTDYLLYEDANFLAINKPSGLATQGGSKISLSVDDALRYLNRTNSTELKLVHRLDKDTSGVLLIAKTHAAAIKLTSAFKDRSISKMYFAVTEGVPAEKSGTIVSFISAKSSKEANQPAITKYKVIKKLPQNKALVEFYPTTGQMHQLRIHAKDLGCPIVGDAKYGATAREKSQNMLLHAACISIPASLFVKQVNIKAPMPEYFGEGGILAER